MNKQDIDKIIAFAKDRLKLKTVPKIQFGVSEDSLGSYNYEKVEITLYENANVETLLHELVHHRQVEQGWLKYNGGNRYWKKKKPLGKSIDMQYIKDYFAAPHEQQARAIASNLKKEYDRITI